MIYGKQWAYFKRQLKEFFELVILFQRCIGWVLYKLTIIGFESIGSERNQASTPEKFLAKKDGILNTNPKFPEFNKICSQLVLNFYKMYCFLIFFLCSKNHRLIRENPSERISIDELLENDDLKMVI